MPETVRRGDAVIEVIGDVDLNYQEKGIAQSDIADVSNAFTLRNDTNLEIALPSNESPVLSQSDNDRLDATGTQDLNDKFVDTKESDLKVTVPIGDIHPREVIPISGSAMVCEPRAWLALAIVGCNRMAGVKRNLLLSKSP